MAAVAVGLVASVPADGDPRDKPEDDDGRNDRRGYSCGYRHGVGGCVAVSSIVHCGNESPSDTSENTIRTRVPMPTDFTTSGGANSPFGNVRFAATRNASSGVGAP